MLIRSALNFHLARTNVRVSAGQLHCNLHVNRQQVSLHLHHNFYYLFRVSQANVTRLNKLVFLTVGRSSLLKDTTR